MTTTDQPAVRIITARDFISALPDTVLVQLNQFLREANLVPDPNDQSSVVESQRIDACSTLVFNEWKTRRTQVHTEWNNVMFGSN